MSDFGKWLMKTGQGGVGEVEGEAAAAGSLSFGVRLRQASSGRTLALVDDEPARGLAPDSVREEWLLFPPPCHRRTGLSGDHLA